MDKEGARHTLGQRIRTMRANEKLSIRAFALMVGLSKDYIVDIEKGRKSPTLDTLVKISMGFGITPSELLHGIALTGDQEMQPEDIDQTLGQNVEEPNKSAVRYHSTRF